MSRSARDDNEGRVRRDGSLFSDTERSAFGSAHQEMMHIYDPGKPKDDPSSQTVRRGPSFGIELHRRERFEAQEQALGNRISVSRQTRVIVLLAIALALAFLAVMILPDYAFDINNHHLSLAWAIDMMHRRITNITLAITGQGAYGGIDFIFFRYLVIMLAGAALAHRLGGEIAVADDQLVAVSHLGQYFQKLRCQDR